MAEVILGRSISMIPGVSVAGVFMFWRRRVELRARIDRRVLAGTGAACSSVARVPERVGVQLSRILEQTRAPRHAVRELICRPEGPIQDVSIRTRTGAGETTRGDPKRNPDEPKEPDVCRARTRVP